MNKDELLIELDTYFATRSTPDWDNPKRSLGDIEIYQVRGAILRLNDRAEEHDITFYVYKRDLPQELAVYSGDPINFFWNQKIIDYITITNEWSGRVFRSNKPKAICRIIETPVEGEKWVLITETSPDNYLVENITGEILTDI